MITRSSTANQRKDVGVESLRGVAIILMVAGHVIGATSEYGLTVADDSPWRLFYEALEDIRMPLFSLLSGFVYAYRPLSGWAEYRPMTRGKIRRLLVPFLVVGTGFYLVQMATPGANSTMTMADLPAAYLYGYQHLWFLQAIFLVFLVVGGLDVAGVLRTFTGWAAATVAAAALYVVVAVPDNAAVFSIDGAMRLLPFFLLGYGAHLHAERVLRREVLLFAMTAFVPVYGVRLWAILTRPPMPQMESRALSVAVGALAVVVLLGARHLLAHRALVWLGGFSFGIYLLHVFGAAGSRIVMTGAGVQQTAVLFVLGLVAGLGLPVLFELTAGRVRWVSWGVLGQRPRNGQALKLSNSANPGLVSVP